MKKIYKLLVFLFILFFCNNIVAFNSSSYLISQSAFKNYDFTTVLHEFVNNNWNFQNNCVASDLDLFHREYDSIIHVLIITSGVINRMFLMVVKRFREIIHIFVIFFVFFFLNFNN